jgi:TPR repeat protein
MAIRLCDAWLDWSSETKEGNLVRSFPHKDLRLPAAEQGNAVAQFNLGNRYLNGRGVTQDNKTAFKWYKLAAEQGDAWAQSILASMYAAGDGVIQDFILAHMWLSISASNGRESAALHLAKVETTMTGDQIVKAKELARECVTKNYKDC